MQYMKGSFKRFANLAYLLDKRKKEVYYIVDQSAVLGREKKLEALFLERFTVGSGGWALII